MAKGHDFNCYCKYSAQGKKIDMLEVKLFKWLHLFVCHSESCFHFPFYQSYPIGDTGQELKFNY